MDMKIDVVLLKTERENRAWSQDHLASAAGLGLRTVQRIEKTRIASYQSVQSLAAALSLQCKDLAATRFEQSGCAALSRFRSMTTAATAIGMIALAAIMVTSSSYADQVMLDFGISENDIEISNGHLLTEEGKLAEVLIEKTLRITLTPTIEDNGKVFLSVEIFEYQDGEFLLVAKPKLITANNKMATIRISFDQSSEYEILITPHTG